MRTRAKCSIPITNPNPTIGGISNVSIYEKSREDRIKENLQRMQNLGILDLSLKLKSDIRPVKRSYTKSNSIPDRKSTRDTPPLQVSVSTRRSSRLKNVTPVTYFEEDKVKKGKASKEVIIWLGKGERPEIYTEEHEKLLGNTERSWELFADGRDKDGKRIYDPVTGKTCHQCRQKTLGYHTQCSQCYPSVTGQFCGDCLYMRYGEHVLEALENPDWICPGCRGICNCSLCRKYKGWLPTGTAYRKISKLGYKSVAHYLIQTKQSKTIEEDEADAAPSQPSANASSEEDHLHFEISDGLQDTNKNLDSARKSLSLLSSVENQTSVIDFHVKEMDPATPVMIDVEADSANKENIETKRSKRRMSVEPNPNSIGGRLRQRRKSQA